MEVKGIDTVIRLNLDLFGMPGKKNGVKDNRSEEDVIKDNMAVFNSVNILLHPPFTRWSLIHLFFFFFACSLCCVS